MSRTDKRLDDGNNRFYRFILAAIVGIVASVLWRGCLEMLGALGF